MKFNYRVAKKIKIFSSSGTQGFRDPEYNSEGILVNVSVVIECTPILSHNLSSNFVILKPKTMHKINFWSQKNLY